MTDPDQETSEPQPDGERREAPPMEVDPKLLESLVCPVSHGPLEYDRDRAELISRHAHLAYPIRKGVPIMTPTEARKLND